MCVCLRLLLHSTFCAIDDVKIATLSFSSSPVNPSLTLVAAAVVLVAAILPVCARPIRRRLYSRHRHCVGHRQYRGLVDFLYRVGVFSHGGRGNVMRTFVSGGAG